MLVRTEASIFVIQLERTADPGWLKHAADHVRDSAAKLGDSAVPVVVVPFMGEFGKQLLREKGIS